MDVKQGIETYVQRSGGVVMHIGDIVVNCGCGCGCDGVRMK